MSDVRERIIEALTQAFPEFPSTTGLRGEVVLNVPPSEVEAVATFLRDKLAMDHLSSVSGVDYPPDRIQVVYHLFSRSTGGKVVLKVDLDRENPAMPSLTGVWPGANWHERETYDLFGVAFTGHPNLKRLLLPEGFVGHPLRKDFVDNRPPRTRQYRTR